MTSASCPKCGSADVVRGIRVVDHGHLNREMPLSATDPHAPGDVYRIRARVCGGCGYVELYVSDPEALLAARRARRDA